MGGNVYREKKVRKVKSIPFPHSFYFPYLNNDDFYPTIKFERQKWFIYLLGQVSQVNFPLNCNCSSFLVWLKSFELEYSMQAASHSWVLGLKLYSVKVNIQDCDISSLNKMKANINEWLC
jgi:hypothetical protein